MAAGKITAVCEDKNQIFFRSDSVFIGLRCPSFELNGPASVPQGFGYAHVVQVDPHRGSGLPRWGALRLIRRE